MFRPVPNPSFSIIHAEKGLGTVYYYVIGVGLEVNQMFTNLFLNNTSLYFQYRNFLLLLTSCLCLCQ